MAERVGFESVPRMKIIPLVLMFFCALGFAVQADPDRQTQSSPEQKNSSPPPPAGAPSSPQKESPPSYSGTYSFLQEGEFVQLTVEEDHRVTGFISRFADTGNPQGDFLDHFFKTGQLEGNRLTFSTQIVQGVAYEFRGTVERGEGKNPGEEGYFVLKGNLTTSTTDATKKVTSKSRDVLFKLFPKDGQPTAGQMRGAFIVRRAQG
jgi:hypothetical protein